MTQKRFAVPRLGDPRGMGVWRQRFSGGAAWNVDGDRVVARHSPTFAADERTTIDAARIIDDPNVIDAVAQRRRRGGLQRRREMELGDTGITAKASIDDHPSPRGAYLSLASVMGPLVCQEHGTTSVVVEPL